MEGDAPIEPLVLAAPVGFEGFFRASQSRLVAIALPLTGDVDAARDLAQEALLRAYRAWPKVSTLDQPGAWTRRVLLNLAVDVSRRRRRESVANGRALPPDSDGSDFTEMSVVDESFWVAVRALPALQRSSVVLHYVDDMSVAEVAEVLEVSEGTVKTSLHRARQTLAKTLEVHDE
jgi:RNA polymerase sigma-70 factor (ECF subfamily)